MFSRIVSISSFFTVLVATAILQSCTDPYEHAAPTTIEEWLSDELKKTKAALRPEDREMLAAWVARMRIHRVMGEVVPEGLTIRDAIRRERELQASENAVKAAEKREQEEREDRVRELLLKLTDHPTPPASARPSSEYDKFKDSTTINLAKTKRIRTQSGNTLRPRAFYSFEGKNLPPSAKVDTVMFGFVSET